MRDKPSAFPWFLPGRCFITISYWLSSSIQRANCAWGYLNPNNHVRHYILDTDASDRAIGAELIQVQNGEERVIAYGSFILTPEQRRYCTTRQSWTGFKFWFPISKPKNSTVFVKSTHFLGFNFRRYFLKRPKTCLKLVWCDWKSLPRTNMSYRKANILFQVKPRRTCHRYFGRKHLVLKAWCQ
jgi:hypothetical protein